MQPEVSGRAMPAAPNLREVPTELALGSGRFAPGHSCQSIRSPACLGRARPSARFPTFRRDRSRRPLQVRAAQSRPACEGQAVRASLSIQPNAMPGASTAMGTA